MLEAYPLSLSTLVLLGLNFLDPFFRILSRLGPQDGSKLEAKMALLGFKMTKLVPNMVTIGPYRRLLMLRRVHCWTSDGSQYMRCTVLALYMSSWNGRL